VVSGHDTELGSEDLVDWISGNLDHEINELVFSTDGNSSGRVDTGNPETAVNASTSEDLLDHEFSLLSTTTQSDHSTITLTPHRHGSTSDSETDSSLTIAMTRSVARSDLTDGVSDDVIILDSERFEEVRE